MVYRFGADLAGKRFVKGRAVMLPGRTETDRIFTLAALDDILLGRKRSSDQRRSAEEMEVRRADLSGVDLFGNVAARVIDDHVAERRDVLHHGALPLPMSKLCR